MDTDDFSCDILTIVQPRLIRTCFHPYRESFRLFADAKISPCRNGGRLPTLPHTLSSHPAHFVGSVYLVSLECTSRGVYRDRPRIVERSVSRRLRRLVSQRDQSLSRNCSSRRRRKNHLSYEAESKETPEKRETDSGASSQRTERYGHSEGP